MNSAKYTFVLAGSHREFKHYYPQYDKTVIYVSNVNHGGKVVRVGTWYERPEREVAYVELP